MDTMESEEEPKSQRSLTVESHVEVPVTLGDQLESESAEALEGNSNTTKDSVNTSADEAITSKEWAFALKINYNQNNNDNNNDKATTKINIIAVFIIIFFFQNEM